MPTVFEAEGGGEGDRAGLLHGLLEGLGVPLKTESYFIKQFLVMIHHTNLVHPPRLGNGGLNPILGTEVLDTFFIEPENKTKSNIFTCTNSPAYFLIVTLF